MPTLDEREAALKKALTPEFLDLLVEVVRVYGHRGDFTEMRAFLGWVHHVAGWDPVACLDDLKPYED